jgi:hypothetical protein
LALKGARRVGREVQTRLSAEQSQHEVSKHALRDAGAELASLRDKLATAAAEASKRTPSIECAEMLRDMAANGALLHVARVDPNDVFMMSPRTAR